MAAGKTTAASELSAQIGWPAVDLDREIEKTCNCSIASIFTEKGESAFRRLEADQLKKVMADSDRRKIVAAGGGIVLLPENRKLLVQASVLFLDTGFAEILRRLRQTGGDRPLLAGCSEADIRIMWKSRRELYINTADFVVKNMTELSRLMANITQEVKTS